MGVTNSKKLAALLAQSVKDYGKPVLLVASTDLNHYEDQEVSHMKDKLVLDAIVKLDPDALIERVMTAMSPCAA